MIEGFMENGFDAEFFCSFQVLVSGCHGKDDDLRAIVKFSLYAVVFFEKFEPIHDWHKQVHQD